MHVGFTGSSVLVTPEQIFGLAKCFHDLREIHSEVTLHHGDCVEGDAVAHIIAAYLRFDIEIHPPKDPKLRRFMQADVIHPEKPYLRRNKDIVNASEFIYALPNGPEKQRSGTWSTVRYARKKEKTAYIIDPKGVLHNDFIESS